MCDEVYNLLYENAKVEEIKVEFNNELESEDEFFQYGRSRKLHNSWEASVSSICAEIASYDPRPQGRSEPQKKKYFSSVTRKWEEVVIPFDDSEIAFTETPPESLPAFQAMGWDPGQQGVDLRPHLWDPKADRFMLVDSGSQCCAWPPDPGDKVDPTITLKAVNGTRLKSYGIKEVDIKLGRKTYKMKVIKADVDKPIIGWNFIRRYKLDMAWNQWGDVCLVDKKAKIQTVLHYKSIPYQEARSTASLRVMTNNSMCDESSPLQTIFEVASMQALTENNYLDSGLKDVKNNLEEMRDSPYKELVKRYPGIFWEEKQTSGGSDVCKINSGLFFRFIKSRVSTKKFS